MLLDRLIETIVRTDGRRVLAGLIRLTGDFDAAEDALQEAYARAIADWPRCGVPDRPGAWLNTVSRRIAIDRLRKARGSELPDDLAAPATDFDVNVSFNVNAGDDPENPSGIEDDRLRLLFVCCHPALSSEARNGWPRAAR